MQKIGAVLTGDIVNSLRYDINIRSKIRQSLLALSKNLFNKNDYKEFIPLPFDIFQGDSWQLLVTSPRESLRISLLIKSYLLSSIMNHRVNTRISIGIGEINPSKERVSMGDGEAFILSGRGLNSQKKDLFFSLYLSEELEEKKPLLKSMNVIFTLIDSICSKWTQKQAYAISYALQGWNNIQIGENWIDSTNVSPQSVGSHLRKAGWYSIETTLEYFESLF
ncbi:MAG TPA: hypothetical protein DCY12_02090 [Candidatus Atribacteria bacterium]|nr:hypothetical protein [Candidatus Atribacteria bacterium]